MMHRESAQGKIADKNHTHCVESKALQKFEIFEIQFARIQSVSERERERDEWCGEFHEKKKKEEEC